MSLMLFIYLLIYAITEYFYEHLNNRACKVSKIARNFINFFFIENFTTHL